jgi:N-acetylglucosamine repressor
MNKNRHRIHSVSVRHKLSGQDLRALRNTNLGVLLSAIWEYNPISRIDLSQSTGLAPSSVTRLLQELIELGLVQETVKGESSGGRLPMLVVPNPSAGLVISLDMSGPYARGGVFDAANNLLDAIDQPFNGFGPEATKHQVFGLIHHLMDIAPHDNRPILAIGISQPGQIDAETGVIREASNFRLHNFPLKQLLKEEFGLPVYIEHDASVAALAEKYFGVAQGMEYFLYILISTGIGSGIISGGQIYRGETGKSGEFGHIIVDPGGPLCVCGKRGCLEAVAAAPAILTSARRMAAHDRSDILLDLCKGTPEKLTIEMVAQAAQMGDLISQEILSRAAEHIALGLLTYASLFDISHMILGGEVAETGDVFLGPLRQALANYGPDGLAINIIPAQLKHKNFLRGISMLTLQEVLRLQVQNL